MRGSGRDGRPAQRAQAADRGPLGPRRLVAIVVLVNLVGCASFAPCGAKGCPDDRRITAEVRGLLDEHDELGAPNLVTVQTVNRVIYLRGLVGTPYQKRLAQYLAGQVPDAARVVNLIGLDNGSR
jgi:osmotically-inducible protein OsmY